MVITDAPRPTLVDAAPAAEHLAKFRSAGVTIKDFAFVSGVSQGTLKAIVRRCKEGPSCCAEDVYDAILSVTFDDCERAKKMQLRYTSWEVPAAPARRHLQMLLKLGDVQITHIAKCAKVTTSTIYRILDGTNSTITRETATKIAASSPEAVLAIARERVRVTPKHIQLLRSMQVQGWSLKWQSERLGGTEAWLWGVASKAAKFITADEAEGIVELAEWVDRQARIGGSPWGPSAEAAGKARAAGWHPLAAYDDNRKLLPGAIRTEGTQKQEVVDASVERKIRLRLDALRLSLDGYSGREVAQLIGTDERQVQRWRTDAGLRFQLKSDLPEKYTMRGVRPTVLRPECAPVADAVQAVLAVYATDKTADLRELYQQIRDIGTRAKAGEFDRPESHSPRKENAA